MHPRATAFAKLKALAEGASIVRRELRGELASTDLPSVPSRAGGKPHYTSMTPSPAVTSASTEGNSGVSHRTRAAREQFPI
jgi:hypothetical protein